MIMRWTGVKGPFRWQLPKVVTWFKSAEGEARMFSKCHKCIVSFIILQIESPLVGRLHGVV